MEPASAGWGDLYERRKAMQERFGRIHALSVVRRVHEPLLHRLRDGQRLLDVGAGSRRLLRTLEARGRRVSYASVDPDTSHGHDFASLAAVRGTYHAVTCFEVLEHVPLDEVRAMLKQMADLLVPGGSLFLSTPNVYKPQEFLRDATHLTPLCYDQLAGMVEVAGLRVDDVYRASGDPFLRRLVRRGLLGWLYRTLDIDFARQILVVASRPG